MRRSRVTNFSYVWKSWPKKQKVATWGIWEKHVRKFFGSHSWELIEMNTMKCSVCDFTIWRVPHISAQAFFKVSFGEHSLGWAAGPVRNCGDTLVEKIQEL